MKYIYMVGLSQLLAIFCTTSTLKYVIFGTLHGFNDILFNFFQYSAVNNYLYNYNDTNYQGVSTLVMWSLFGMSPHGDANHTIAYLNNIFGNPDMPSHSHLNNKSEIAILPNNDDSQINQTSDEFSDITFWFDTNKYMLVILAIFGVLSMSIIVYFIIKFGV